MKVLMHFALQPPQNAEDKRKYRRHMFTYNEAMPLFSSPFGVLPDDDIALRCARARREAQTRQILAEKAAKAQPKSKRRKKTQNKKKRKR